MHQVRYAVYYDTPNGRPRKDFGPDREAAISWASRQETNRNAEVRAITEETIWSAGK